MEPPIRIVSDLHLGHPASPLVRAEQVRGLWRGVGELWLLGDTLETCSERLEGPSRQLYAEVSALAAADGVALRRFRGNHDPDEEVESHAFLDDGSVLLTHGDACFRFGSPWSPWARVLREKLEEVEAEAGGEDALATIDERMALALRWSRSYFPRRRRFTGFAGKLETFAHVLWPPQVPITILRHWLEGPEMAARWMERFAPSAEVLLIGHTHRPGAWRRRGRWILNLGAHHPFGYPRMADWSPGHLVARSVRVESRGARGPGSVRGEWRRDPVEGWLEM